MLLDKKYHFFSARARAAEAHGRFWVQMHDFGHTKAWLLAGALWLFSEMTWATLRTLPAPIVIVIIVVGN